jgi:hypothetical protein
MSAIRAPEALKMAERIKFIWDFYGSGSKPTATHHIKHLGEFVAGEKLDDIPMGIEEVTPKHHIAYMVVEREMMDNLRQILKPHRGQIYEE